MQTTSKVEYDIVDGKVAIRRTEEADAVCDKTCGNITDKTQHSLMCPYTKMKWSMQGYKYKATDFILPTRR